MILLNIGTESLKVPAVGVHRIDSQTLLYPAVLNKSLNLETDCATFLHRANDTIAPKLFGTKSGRFWGLLGASTSKKVIVRRFDREPVNGYVNPATYLQADGLEVLSTSGSVSRLPYSDIKAVCFVRDFNASEQDQQQRLFHARPKMEGLWVRMRFRDGDVMDGLLPNSLLDIEPAGFTVVPPNPSSNSQKLFVPKGALDEFHVLAVVGSPLHPRKPKLPSKEQMEMFE
jgi:hypothetical protein